MIFNLLLAITLGIINIFFGILPTLPQVPVAFSSAINDFFDLIFNNSGLVKQLELNS